MTREDFEHLRNNESSNMIRRLGILQMVVASNNISANNLKSLLNNRPDITINSTHKTLFYKKTPLHVAVINGNYNKAKVLINHGAKTNIRDGSNKTPLDYAKNNKMRNLLSPQRVKNNFKTLSLLYGRQGFSPALASKFTYNGFSNNRKRIVNNFRKNSS